jgi:hypothetical protein
MKLAASPDERLWFFAPAAAAPAAKTMDNDAIRARFVALAQNKDPNPVVPKKLVAVAAPPAPVDEKLAFGPRTPLRVEVETNDARRDAEMTDAYTSCLRAMGQTLGDGGFTLKVSAHEEDTPEIMDFGPSSSQKVKIPLVTGRIELRDPDDSVVYSQNLTHRFPRNASKYHKTGRDLAPGPGTIIQLYDFRGQDPHKAMADETWHLFLLGTRFYGGTGLVKKDNKYVPVLRREVLAVP